MQTHRLDHNCKQTNDHLSKFRYRLLANGAIVDKQDNYKDVGYICNKNDLDVIFKMNRGQQQKLLIQYINGEEPQT